jgi:MFS transporter, ACS family, D-galactonate transporter
VGSGRRQSRAAVTLIVLLTTSIFINYIDRSNLSVAAPLLQKDPGYSLRQIGILSSGFFWTYSLFQLLGVSGWIADRFSAGKVFTFSFLLWSVVTAASGMVWSFAAFFLMRLLLGLGESFAYPCYSRLIAQEIPQRMRGRANALLDAGSKLGPGIGTLLGGLLLERYGWRWFFMVLGLAGLLWLLPWFLWMPRTPPSPPRSSTGGDSVAHMLRLRTAWGTFAGHFCGNYFWFFLLIWLPTYLVNDRGLSIHKMANTGSVAYFVVAAGTLTAGWISDGLLRKGASVTRVRKSVVITGLLGSTAILPVAVLRDPHLSLTLLYVACFAFGTYTSNHWVITQTLAGPTMAGRWTSLQNGIGNFSGVVASWVTGMLVQRTGSFQLAFLLAAIVALAGAFMWGVVVGPVREIPWEARREHSIA